MDTSAGPTGLAGRKEFIGLAVLALPTILVALDMSVLYLALPHLSGDLGASSVQQLWITDIYGFLVAGLLITMGNIGDRIGRKKLLMIGAAAFAVVSILAAYSTSPEMLIVMRALLGVAGSTIMPSTMALIAAMFPNPKQMSMAMGVWMGCFMGGTALGPIIGGGLLEFFWWGSVFLIGVPVMVILLVVGPKVLPEFKNPAAGKIDPASVVLSLLAILPVIYGLKQISHDGLSAVSIVAVVVGVACTITFLRRQKRIDSPLLDLTLFKNRTFSSALSMTVASGFIAGNQLFVYMYLQSVSGLSPVATALWLVPPALCTLVMIQVAPLLARRIPPGRLMAVGLVVSAIGYLLLTQLDSTGNNIPLLLTGLIIANIGMGPLAGLGAALAMQSAPWEKFGAAAGMTSTSGEFGVAMGVAVLGTVGTTLYRNTVVVDPAIPAAQAHAAGESIAGAQSVAGSLPPAESGNLLNSAYEAITSSVHGTAIGSAIIIAAAAVIAAVGLRHLPATGQQQAPAPEAAAEPDAEAADTADTAAEPAARS
ncbi:MFS transporter [Amycolatopsis sp. WQ 127309]|uniref:MFS transporter n=1 Tax=Amycolatopsis sp. WQ 127309 TaxID=2932773 RepID=UPI002111F7A0|nr:MFS transporter [Amycolatopsis sp. WQ 127309]